MGDGSGKLANNNLFWDSIGNVEAKGTLSVGAPMVIAPYFFAGLLNRNTLHHPNAGQENLSDTPLLSLTNGNGGTYSVGSEATILPDTTTGTASYATRGAAGDGGIRPYYISSLGPLNLVPGTNDFIVSAYVKDRSGTSPFTVAIGLSQNGDTNIETSNFSIDIANGWTRIFVKRTAIALNGRPKIYLTTALNTSIYIADIQLEVANTITEPTPYQRVLPKTNINVSPSYGM